MTASINSRVKSANLTDTEREAVGLIIQDVDNMVFLNSFQIAERCGVSPAFITRLTRKLEYASFKEFKNDLNSLYKKSVNSYDLFQSYLDKGVNNDIVADTLTQDMNNITAMEQMLDKRTLNGVVNKIINAETVYMASMFGSEIITKALSWYLWRLGKQVVNLTGVGVSQKVKYSHMGEKDLLIAVSSLRVFREVFESVVIAKERGTDTVAITDNPTNPLATECDLTLFSPVKGIAIDNTHAATLLMIDILVNSVAAKMPNAVAETLAREENNERDEKIFCL